MKFLTGANFLFISKKLQCLAILRAMYITRIYLLSIPHLFLSLSLSTRKTMRSSTMNDTHADCIKWTQMILTTIKFVRCECCKNWIVMPLDWSFLILRVFNIQTLSQTFSRSRKTTSSTASFYIMIRRIDFVLAHLFAVAISRARISNEKRIQSGRCRVVTRLPENRLRTHRRDHLQGPSRIWIQNTVVPIRVLFLVCSASILISPLFKTALIRTNLITCSVLRTRIEQP